MAITMTIKQGDASLRSPHLLNLKKTSKSYHKQAPIVVMVRPNVTNQQE